jgi:arylsulfatase A-like enzyme
MWLPRETNEQAPTFPPPRYTAADSETRFLTDAALDHIADCAEGWLVHLSYLRPHPPFIAPEPYNAMYHPADVPPFRRAADRAQESAQHPWLAYHLTKIHAAPLPEQERPLLGSLDDDALRQLRATYYGMVTQVDDDLGRLFAALRASGAYERTLIIVTTDHGEQLGDHWMLGKDGYFDAAFHIPLIVRDPRAAPRTRGRHIDAFTEAVDVMPTVLEFLGLEVPPQLDGRSLAPILAGATPPDWRREVHWEYDFRDLRELGPETALGLDSEECSLTVIRDERYKYVHFAGLPPLFFDLAADPDEFQDRAADSAYLPLLLAYARKLLSWRMRHEERTLSHVHLGPGGMVTRRPVKI